MRKLLTLSIVAVLSLFSTAAFADFSDELEGKKIAIGEALQTPADIQEGTWYVIATLYSSRLYDNMYMYDKYYSDSYDKLYFWDKNDAVYSGMDATDDDALRTLVRFVPVTVSGYDSDTYYLEFATGRRAYLYDNAQNNYVRLYLNEEYEQPVYTYNISGEAGHFGFYVASENQYRLYGGYANGSLYITTWSTGAAEVLNAQYDFAIYPAIAESDEDLLEASYNAFVSTYEQYSALTWDTGTNPGQYSAESVAALNAALAEVADLVGAGASSKTADEWSELTSTLKEAYNAAIESQITTVDYADGQYFIEIAGLESETAYAVYPDADYSYYYLDWGALDETNELHIWNVTAVGDGSYTVKNAYTNSTFNEFVTSDYDWATLSESSNIKMVFDYDHTNDAGEYVVKIRTSTNTKGYLWAAGVSNNKSSGYMWSWTGTDSGSYFKLVNISDEEAEEFVDDEMVIGDEVKGDNGIYQVTGENLFVNGSFNDGVNGWKATDYATDAVIDNFTITTTGGYNGGAYITTTAAGAGSETTIRQSIAVEAGKPYLFIAYTSGETPAENNKRYNALMQMESATEEVSVDSQPVDVVTLEWGADAGETATEWTRTEAVFIAPTDYVGMRMGWNNNTSFDAFQLYPLELTQEMPVEDGVYVLQNVGTGQYLGGGNSWDTQGSILATPQQFTIEGQDDGTYTLASYQYNSETKHYLGTNLYVDSDAAGWTIADLGDGTYSLYNETAGGYLNGNVELYGAVTASSEADAWKLISLDDVVASQEEATAENPVDVTALIWNPTLNRESQSYEVYWTTTDYSGEGTVSPTFGYQNNTDYANAVEVYHIDGGFDINQTLTGLKAGNYVLSAQAFYRDDNEDAIAEGLPVLYVGDNEAQLMNMRDVEDTNCSAIEGTSQNMHTAFLDFIAGSYPVSVAFTVAEGEDVTIGVKAENTSLLWTILGELNLVYAGPEIVEGPVADGIYMIKNVEVGQYLGGGNAWGTQASLLTRPQQFTLEALNDGTYTIASYQYNGVKHYLNGVDEAAYPYCDAEADTWGTWTLAETDEEGVYTLCLGDDNYLTATEEGGVATTQTDPTAAGTTWQLITMADIVASQADATAENPVDVTGLIMNPTLNYGSQANEHWTVASYDKDSIPTNYNFGGSRNGSTNGNDVVESYHSANGFNIYQTLEGLTAGYYEFSAQGFYRDDSEEGVTEGLPELYAGDAATTLPDEYSAEGESVTGQSMATAYTDFLAGLYPVSVQFVLDEAGDVTIGVRGNSADLWNIFGEINLTYYGTAGFPEGNDDVETGINSAAAAAENGAIYTIQGIRVSNMSQPGIYIQNGKKILVK
ncbi:MAG: hypothetical protein LUC44_01025 [Prevotellaceae bacterium]|nr:hypothetical protein [Prevotellaceae bacterium]